MLPCVHATVVAILYLLNISILTFMASEMKSNFLLLVLKPIWNASWWHFFRVHIKNIHRVIGNCMCLLENWFSIKLCNKGCVFIISVVIIIITITISNKEIRMFYDVQNNHKRQIKVRLNSSGSSMGVFLHLCKKINQLDWAICVNCMVGIIGNWKSVCIQLQILFFSVSSWKTDGKLESGTEFVSF